VIASGKPLSYDLEELERQAPRSAPARLTSTGLFQLSWSFVVLVFTDVHAQATFIKFLQSIFWVGMSSMSWARGTSMKSPSPMGVRWSLGRPGGWAPVGRGLADWRAV